MDTQNSSGINNVNTDTTPGIAIPDVTINSKTDFSSLFSGGNVGIGGLIMVALGVAIWFFKFRSNTNVGNIIQTHDAKDHQAQQKQQEQVVEQLNVQSDKIVDNVKKTDEKIEEKIADEQHIISKNVDQIEIRQETDPSPPIQETDARIKNLMNFFK